MNESEIIMTMPASARAIVPRDGFTPCDPAAALAGLSFDFRPRTPELEADESRLQAIPYVLVRMSVPGGPYVFYRRGGSSAEARLHDRWSLGFGGHVRRSDALGNALIWDTIRSAAARELAEELGCDVSPSAIEWLGLIVDRSDAVGRVHLGIIGRITVPGLPASPGAPDEVAARRLVSLPPPDGQPWHPGTIDAMNMESWSRIVIQAMKSGDLAP